MHASGRSSRVPGVGEVRRGRGGHPVGVPALVFIFFSSRRRHMRYWRDWSSDVCSSDLAECSTRAEDQLALVLVVAPTAKRDVFDGGRSPVCIRLDVVELQECALGASLSVFGDEGRSEERRVGKEGRSRWSPYH